MEVVLEVEGSQLDTRRPSHRDTYDGDDDGLPQHDLGRRV